MSRQRIKHPRNFEEMNNMIPEVGDRLAAYRRNLTTVMLEECKEDDVRKMIRTHIDLGNEGKIASAKLIFDFIKSAEPVHPPQVFNAEEITNYFGDTNINIVSMQEDLVRLIAANGPSKIGKLIDLIDKDGEIPPSAIEAALKRREWFEPKKGRYAITHKAREVVLEANGNKDNTK